MKNTKIAINGFGRIGRLFLRQILAQKNFEVVAINDLGDIENLAYLFKYDSVYRAYEESVDFKHNADGIGGKLIVGDKEIMVIQEKDPSKLPWGELGVDIVVESTGAFESFEKSGAHLIAGAKRVVLTAPAKDEDRADAKTILMGLNEDDFKTCKITSNGSCTTNATHPVISILHESIGIKKAFLATTHGYTATQNLVDGPTRGKDFRRGRAAAINISPSFTGAAISVTRPIPELAGKFDGLAYRVPMAAGSLADITFLAKRNTSIEEVNSILEKSAGEKRWKGIFKVTNDQIVSSDIIGDSYGSIVDLSCTKVVDGDFVKVLAWYDNEWGYVSTLVKHVAKAAEAI